jgi:acetylserotonin N-methyltransferase
LPAVTAAADCGVFAALDESEWSLDELSDRLGLNRRALLAVARMLASLGFVALSADTLRATEVSRAYLVGTSAFSMLPALRLGLHRSLHDQLIAALRGDTAAFQASRANMPAEDWARGAISVDRAATVATIMQAHSLPAANALARSGLLAGIRHLLDVGGGSGCYSIALAEQHPEFHATVLDLPAMCECATSYIAKAALQSRIGVFAGDMLRRDWPIGYDAILLCNVLHDWSFETSAELVARAFAALPSGGRILVHEMLLDDDGAGPPTTAAFSLMMLLATWGQQFTREELYSLFRRAGFRDFRTTPTHGYYSLVEGRRP